MTRREDGELGLEMDGQRSYQLWTQGWVRCFAAKSWGHLCPAFGNPYVLVYLPIASLRVSVSDSYPDRHNQISESGRYGGGRSAVDTTIGKYMWINWITSLELRQLIEVLV